LVGGQLCIEQNLIARSGNGVPVDMQRELDISLLLAKEPDIQTVAMVRIFAAPEMTTPARAGVVASKRLAN